MFPTTLPETIYVVLSYQEWLEFKRTETIPEDTFYNFETREWIREQVHNRVKNACGTVPEKYKNIDPIYCHVTKPIPSKTFPRKHVVCKVRVHNARDIVHFDDNMYVSVLNCFQGNGRYYYSSYNEQEDIEKNDIHKASKEKCLESYERMFDMDISKRSQSCVGPIEKRAFIPYLTKDMIRKVWIYSGNGKRIMVH